MMNIPDNYDRWRTHDAELEESLLLLPECIYCGERIQEDYLYIINDEILCEHCMEKHFRKPTEDYIKK
jgi:formylmethanofuran dehydrogenase subunit E